MCLKHPFALVYPIVLLLVVCISAEAQEITVGNLSGVGTRAMGMGGAYVAVSEDFSATYWNPAGLAQIKRIELYGSLSHHKQKVESSFYGGLGSSEISKTKLNSLGVVLPVPTYRGSLVFALGLNRIKSFDSIFSIDGYSTSSLFYRKGTDLDDGGLTALSIAGAIEVSPSISLGLSLNVLGGTDKFSHDLLSLDRDDAHQDTVSVTEKLSFEDDYSGVNLTLAMLVRAPLGFRFGAAVISPLTLTVEENWRSEYEVTVSGPTPRRGGDSEEFKYKVYLPYELAFGTSWSVLGILTLAADLRYVDWTQTSYDEPPSEGLSNEDFRNKYDGTTNFHLGAEVFVPIFNVDLRTGYWRDPIPYFGPREEGGPKIKVKDERDYVSFGMGKLIDKVLYIDVAWLHGVSDQREGEIFEKRTVDTIFTGISYRF